MPTSAGFSCPTAACSASRSTPRARRSTIPRTNSVSTVAGFPGSAAYVGGVLMPDGRVFCVPRNATSASIYDPVANTVSTVAGFPGSDAYIGGVLMPDGRVFCVPHNATSASIYDPVANTVSTVAGFPGSGAYSAACSCPTAACSASRSTPRARPSTIPWRIP
jgi:hypothetical protein